MSLEELFLAKLGDLAAISYKRMFGWEAILAGGKLVGGYKMLDENIMNLMLILPQDQYQDAIEQGIFSKYSFGRTWVEAEIGSGDELEGVWGSVLQAHRFALGKTR